MTSARQPTESGTVVATTMSPRRLQRFLLVLAVVLSTCACVSSFTSHSSVSHALLTNAWAIHADGEDAEDLDAEYDSGINALLDKKKGKRTKTVVPTYSTITDDLGLEDSEDAAMAAALADYEGEEDLELPDMMDYNDKDDEDEEDDDDEPADSKTKVSNAANGKSLKKSDRKKQRNNNKLLKKRKAADGVLPKLSEQADRLYEQSVKLSDQSEAFKREAAALGSLPKKLLATAGRLNKMAKESAYKSNALNFNTQAKKLKEQSRRIQDILAHLLDRIPEYDRESQKLRKQSEGLKDVADEHLLHGVAEDDPSTIELRREVKKLEKDYAKQLKKSDELQSALKQLLEQGEQVNQLAGQLPPDMSADTVESIDDEEAQKPKKKPSASSKVKSPKRKSQ